MHDLFKIVTLVLVSWAIPQFFDFFENQFWKLSTQNRVGLEGISYFVLLIAIIALLKDALDRAYNEGRREEHNDRVDERRPKSS